MTLNIDDAFREDTQGINVQSLSKKSRDTDAEDNKLRQLGIRRELRREFTNFSTLSFALGVIGLEFHLHSTHFIL